MIHGQSRPILVALRERVLVVPDPGERRHRLTPSWKLTLATRSECDDLAMIGPRNDSRTNLILLLADLPGAARPRQAIDLPRLRSLI